jgi:hypothetical protein
VRLVLFPLLDRAGGTVQIVELLEALQALPLEIGIGHRMPEHGDQQAAGP